MKGRGACFEDGPVEGKAIAARQHGTLRRQGVEHDEGRDIGIGLRLRHMGFLSHLEDLVGRDAGELRVSSEAAPAFRCHGPG